MAARSDSLRAALGGVVAGVVAGAAMNGIQTLWNAARGDTGGSGEEPATVKAADKAARATTGAPIPGAYRKAADAAVHYGLSAVLGAAYAIAADAAPVVTAGHGGGFGVATWLLIDEALVPALDLGPPPAETPLATHLYAACAHLVFGMTLEAARRALGGRTA